MTDEITMNVQQWTFERGNYQIVVENAWNLPRFTQERITVNGVRVRDCIPQRMTYLFWRTMFEDTILNKDGEQTLQVQWKSGLKTVKARVLVDGEHMAWTKAYSKKWTGPKGAWPEDKEYEV